MTKRDLVESVEALAGLPRSVAQTVVDALLAVITNELKRGGDVRVLGFGNFTVTKRAAAIGRNPHTGKEVSIPARAVPKFSPGKGLKDAIN